MSTKTSFIFINITLLTLLSQEALSENLFFAKIGTGLTSTTINKSKLNISSDSAEDYDYGIMSNLGLGLSINSNIFFEAGVIEGHKNIKKIICS